MRTILVAALVLVLASCSRGEEKKMKAAAPASGPCGNQDQAGVQVVATNHCVVPREVRLFSNACAEDVVIERVEGKTELAGLKMRGIRAGSVYAKCGFHDGDVWAALDGVSLSRDKLLQAYVRMREVHDLSFSVLRDGKPVAVRIERK
jgi:type II secretory pathway component PulC